MVFPIALRCDLAFFCFCGLLDCDNRVFPNPRVNTLTNEGRDQSANKASKNKKGPTNYAQVMYAFLRQLKLVVDDDSSLKMLQLFDHQVRL